MQAILVIFLVHKFSGLRRSRTWVFFSRHPIQPQRHQKCVDKMKCQIVLISSEHITNLFTSADRNPFDVFILFTNQQLKRLVIKGDK